jgi:hypothetical protein
MFLVMKAMFQADPPIQTKPPIVKRKMPPYSGIAQFVGAFETTEPQPRPVFEDFLQRKVS